MNRRSFLQSGLAGTGALVMAEKLSALKYYPSPSDKKCAVLYGTWCGSTRDAAVWISEGMGGIADVFDVRENPDLRSCDHIIIGGAIRMMVTSVDLQGYIKMNKDWLKEKICGLFAVCGNMGQPVGPSQTSKFIDNHLAKLCEVTEMSSRVFLGRVTKSLMDPETAGMMAGFEDYDNLSRPECLAFGAEIFDRITKE